VAEITRRGLLGGIGASAAVGALAQGRGAAHVTGTVRAEDWMETTTPGAWRFGAVKRSYGWSGMDGAWPFGA